MALGVIGRPELDGLRSDGSVGGKARDNFNFDAVPTVVAPGNDISVLSAMALVDSFPARVAFTTDARVAGSYPGSAGCAIRWIEDAPDHVVLETEAPDRSFVVVADAWFEGWRARLDGQDVAIARVDHMLRGVPVSAGRHRLAMDYEPVGWSAAVATTRAAGTTWLLLLLVAVAYPIVQARRGRPG